MIRTTHDLIEAMSRMRRFHLMKSLLVVLGLVTILLPGFAFGATAPPAPAASAGQLFLSWRAPYGTPGAFENVTVTCEDTSRVDTLYLSFEMSRARPPITHMSATLLFHPQGSDTLGPFWWFKRGWANETNLRIDFDELAGFPCDLPWSLMGNGQVAYDHRSGRGRLELEFDVQADPSRVVSPNTRYCLARVMIRHLRNSLAGCMQPVCVELADVQLMSATGKSVLLDQGEHRFTTWNRTPGSICRPKAEVVKIPTWRPPVGKRTGQ